MAENGKEEYAVYVPIKHYPESCARLGPTWPSYREAAGSESAKMSGRYIVKGDRAGLRAQLSSEEVERRKVAK